MVANAVWKKNAQKTVQIGVTFLKDCVTLKLQWSELIIIGKLLT